ncbi:MAG: UDP-N-acetylmuramate--L-alanine ligase [Oscillospiraceae bacterium]|jgi:UDP-N-acetylmuramate--alanine ligase|nr:UDP-N-acetylmuramate--L-alanine ligase [Oscillospiraceae bacterium]
MDIQTALSPGSKVLIVGIGGVSMSSLADVLHKRGVDTYGCDRRESAATRRLAALGIPISYNEDPALLDGMDAVVRTAAARDDHPLIVAAKSRGLPVFERAAAWGHISRDYKHCVCVAGTHGKTTTTGMFTHIAMEHGDPTVMLGGTLPLLGGTHRIGGGDTIILESCEYTNSYHHFSPTVAVILNVEPDHLDFFKNFDEILESFAHFCALVPETGHVLLNADDAGCAALAPLLSGRVRGKVLRFGMAADADIRAEKILIENGCYSFEVSCGGSFYTSIRLAVPGLHNASNAMAAVAAAWVTGIPGKAAHDGLAAFGGTERRLERLGEVNGIPVYDDYAHHPTAIRVTLDAVREMNPRRILLAFQPHTYTRTRALFDGFTETLGLADAVFLAEIYSAREVNTDGLSSARLAEKIPGAVFAPTFPELAGKIREAARPGDIIIVMGAGNIRELGEMLVSSVC